MRICPTCSTPLKDYNYYFCNNCLSELPTEKVKIPSPHLINVKLDYVLIPQERFLFLNIPYENRFSLKVIKFLIYLTLITSLVLFIFYNFNYGY
jgi:hypothetical protein